MCKFGASCKYHHPKHGAGSSSPITLNFYGYPLRQVYYVNNFGSYSYFSINFLILSILVILKLLSCLINFSLQGEKECSYYIKTGQCKFGVTCKFHHPQPAGIQMPAPGAGPGHLAGPAAMPTPALYPPVQSPPLQSSQQYGVLHGNWPVSRPTMLPGSYVPGSYGPMLLAPGVVPVPGWNPYSVSFIEVPFFFFRGRFFYIILVFY